MEKTELREFVVSDEEKIIVEVTLKDQKRFLRITRNLLGEKKEICDWQR